jgi:hypothetical protein
LRHSGVRAHDVVDVVVGHDDLSREVVEQSVVDRQPNETTESEALTPARRVHFSDLQRGLHARSDECPVRHFRARLVAADPRTASSTTARASACRPAAGGVRLCGRHRDSGGEPLPYGITKGNLKCDSAKAGITRRDSATGHGFTISREAYKVF